jgi:hypothetical protein
MIPRRKPLNRNRSWLRRGQPREPKRSQPGGEYVLTHRGKQHVLPGRYIVDPTSPDGKRWIAHSSVRPILAQIVFELSGGLCEIKNGPDCWGYAARWNGHPHHVKHKKMGGAFTDDRIFLEIDGQVVRIRVWGCPTCHKNHHNKLHWTGESA